jgi:4-hydroxy-tetrahydrodipicolinate synthase
MRANGEVDYAALEQLLQLHIASGTAAVVIGGTTGEGSAMSADELAETITAAVKVCVGRIGVIAGIGANSTSEAIARASMAKECGAQAGMAVAPYYVRPNQLGLVRHFEAVAQATALPQILYNIPGRTAVDMHDSTILALAANPLFVGIKDATADLARAARIISAAPSHFACYSGDDATALAFMLLGGQGSISVAANILPRSIAQLCAMALAGQVADARALNARLLPVYQALALDSNPIPIKYAMSYVRMMEGALRLPLVELDSQRGDQLIAAFRDAAPYVGEIAGALRDA